MINSHAPLLGLAVRPPCSCLRWSFVGVTALHAERPGTPSDVSARNERLETPLMHFAQDENRAAAKEHDGSEQQILAEIKAKADRVAELEKQNEELSAENRAQKRRLDDISSDHNLVVTKLQMKIDMLS